MSFKLVNKKLNSDSRVNKTVNDHNTSFQERELIILLIIIFPQVRYNNYDKNIIIIGDSMLNNINNRGLCKSKKVSVSNFPGATSEDILAEAEDTLKLHPDNLIVHARNK